MEDAFLYYVTKFTRHRLHEQPNFLDLAITNEEGMLTTIEYDSPLGNSDHTCTVYDMNLYADMQEREQKWYNFYNGNYEQIASNFGTTDRTNRMANMNVHEHLRKQMEDNIPMVKVKKNKKTCINQEVAKLRECKLAKWKCFKVTQNINDHRLYKEDVNALRNLTRFMKRF